MVLIDAKSIVSALMTGSPRVRAAKLSTLLSRLLTVLASLGKSGGFRKFVSENKSDSDILKTAYVSKIIRTINKMIVAQVAEASKKRQNAVLYVMASNLKTIVESALTTLEQDVGDYNTREGVTPLSTASIRATRDVLSSYGALPKPVISKLVSFALKSAHVSFLTTYVFLENTSDQVSALQTFLNDTGYGDESASDVVRTHQTLYNRLIGDNGLVAVADDRSAYRKGVNATGEVDRSHFIPVISTSSLISQLITKVPIYQNALEDAYNVRLSDDLVNSNDTQAKQIATLKKAATQSVGKLDKKTITQMNRNYNMNVANSTEAGRSTLDIIKVIATIKKAMSPQTPEERSSYEAAIVRMFNALGLPDKVLYGIGGIKNRS